MAHHHRYADTTLCSILVERFHHALADELPRLSRLARSVADASRSYVARADAAGAMRCLQATTCLDLALRQHTTAAVQLVHPALGTERGAAVVRAHVAEHERLRTLWRTLMDALVCFDVGSLSSRDVPAFRALVVRARKLGDTLTAFFSMEAVLEIAELVDERVDIAVHVGHVQEGARNRIAPASSSSSSSSSPPAWPSIVIGGSGVC